MESCRDDIVVNNVKSTPLTKKCTSCKEELPTNLFYISRREKDGYTPECKACRTDYNRTQREPDVSAFKLTQWPQINRLMLKRCISTMWEHTFDTTDGGKLIVDFSKDRHDISLHSPEGELLITYRFVNSDQTQAINRIISILHDEDVKLVPK